MTQPLIKISFYLVDGEVSGGRKEIIYHDEYTRIDSLTPAQIREIVAPRRDNVTDINTRRKNGHGGCYP